MVGNEVDKRKAAAQIAAELCPALPANKVFLTVGHANSPTPLNRNGDLNSQKFFASFFQ
jgi:hypothetical protein